METEVKTINEMTTEEILAVPHISEMQVELGAFDSLVIVPTEDIHDSDYRCMQFVAVKLGLPICRLSGGSDVVHIDWITRYGTVPTLTPLTGWSIDCLKVSGLINLFTHGDLFTDGRAYSSFEIYSQPKPKKK